MTVRIGAGTISVPHGPLAYAIGQVWTLQDRPAVAPAAPGAGAAADLQGSRGLELAGRGAGWCGLRAGLFPLLMRGYRWPAAA